MTAQPSRLVGRVGLAMYVVLLIALTKYAAAPLTNEDTYFHLRFGHEFISDWTLRDPGSVSSQATRAWLPTQWLSQITMAHFEDAFGLPGVAWLFGAVLMAYAVTIYAVCRSRSTPIIAITVMTLTLMGSSPGLSARPQVMSYLFAALVMHAWLRSADDGKPRWWLVPLTWLWAMCHGMWPVGLAIGLVATVGIALDRKYGRTRLLQHLAVCGLSAVAAALTPVGPGLYGAVLTVTGRSTYFSEWGPANFKHAAPLIVAVMLAACIAAYARRGGLPWARVALLLLALAWALYSLRTVPIAAAMCAPLLAEALRGELPIDHAPRAERIIRFATPVVCLAALAVAVPETSAEPLPFPSWAEARIQSLAPGTPVLTEGNLGSFLMWKFPQLDFTSDGYGDAYTNQALDAVTTISNVAPGWDVEVAKTGARIAVLKADSPLAYSLIHEEGWHSVQPSTTFVVLDAPEDWPAETALLPN